MTVRLVGDRIARSPVSNEYDWRLDEWSSGEGQAVGVTDVYGDQLGVFEPGHAADPSLLWVAAVAGEEKPTWALTPPAARALARLLNARADEIEKGEG